MRRGFNKEKSETDHESTSTGYFLARLVTLVAIGWHFEVFVMSDAY